MPNWCQNTLVLNHEDPEMIKRAEKAFAEGKFCQEFYPIPAELSDTTSPNRDGAQADILLEKYGYADWYSFSVNEWGTKWDFGDAAGINDVQENEIVLYFDSAWSPPIALMEKLEALGFEVDLMYNEPGMAFCGRYAAGHDDFYEYGGMSAADVVDFIQPELDEAFCISENMQMYEDEQE